MDRCHRLPLNTISSDEMHSTRVGESSFSIPQAKTSSETVPTTARLAVITSFGRLVRISGSRPCRQAIFIGQTIFRNDVCLCALVFVWLVGRSVESHPTLSAHCCCCTQTSKKRPEKGKEKKTSLGKSICFSRTQHTTRHGTTLDAANQQK